ncbi:hopanoid biosynthesis-associated protein HpnK [Saccharibacter floricola]|uniref:Sugar phosphotransferase system protein n=1 Tax=Saccharibacter floricola DSM 15669 TaxID=1123227 RepID=A0ABQ0NXN8_9PROT|nr:hopanoid biosynthesis-associated protein HpnK [Saccharibacter floricola]GBQ05966.1 sugar phosphotransferase system protein [Saccharibacter floricola DSM 15669]
MASSPLSPRRAIISADDFGMSYEVNEAIECAHRNGVLTTTSLMVAAPAAEDALRRARRLPSLKVGLHLVTIEGDSVLKLPAITDDDGWFGRDQLKLGVEYFFSPRARSAMKREIEAQFRAFSRTGIPLDHANAHKHMHLHPTIGRMLIETGQVHGLKAVRTPAEPAAPLGMQTSIGDRALWYWTHLLRAQIRHAKMKTNDSCFGLRWSGHMTPQRIQSLIPRLPAGVSEIYFHPATAQNASMAALMPGYDQEGELAALLAPQTRELLEQHSIQPIGWSDL